MTLLRWQYSQSNVKINKDEVTESKPSFIYEVIETLLPTACYHPEKNPDGKGLLQL